MSDLTDMFTYDRVILQKLRNSSWSIEDKHIYYFSRNLKRFIEEYNKLQDSSPVPAYTYKWPQTYQNISKILEMSSSDAARIFKSVEVGSGWGMGQIFLYVQKCYNSKVYSIKLNGKVLSDKINFTVKTLVI